MDLIFPLASSAFLGDLRETRLLMFAPFDLPRDGVFKRDLGAVCAVFLLPFRALTIFFRLPKTFFAEVGGLCMCRAVVPRLVAREVSQAEKHRRCPIPRHARGHRMIDSFLTTRLFTLSISHDPLIPITRQPMAQRCLQR